jgi:hypothetical protein
MKGPALKLSQSVCLLLDSRMAHEIYHGKRDAYGG